MFSKDQEDEQSCFSDNTHMDILSDAIGIENVWLGRYKRADASMLKVPGLFDLVAAKSPDLAQKTSQSIAASVAAAKQIQPPFDQEISGGADGKGSARIQATINSLVAQSMGLVNSANAVGIQKLTLSQP